MGQRIRPKGISPDFGHDKIGLEGPDNRGNHLLERVDIDLVVRPFGQGDIDVVPDPLSTTYLIHPSRSGIKCFPGLVERNDQGSVLLIKGILDAIAVMCVDIDNCHLQSALNSLRNGNGDVIDVAEPLGIIPTRVVKPSEGIKGHISLPVKDEPHPHIRRPRGHKGPLINTRHDGIILRSDAMG